MSSIDSEKIVELLFDNSEQLSTNIYVDLMALMKRYHDYEDNQDQIEKYLDSKKDFIDEKILLRIKKYIAKPPFCHISKEGFCMFMSFVFYWNYMMYVSR